MLVCAGPRFEKLWREAFETALNHILRDGNELHVATVVPRHYECEPGESLPRRAWNGQPFSSCFCEETSPVHCGVPPPACHNIPTLTNNIEYEHLMADHQQSTSGRHAGRHPSARSSRGWTSKATA